MKRILSFLLVMMMVFSVSAAFAADPVPVSSIILNETTVTLAPNTTAFVKATVEPKNATNKKLVWSSSDETVATVINGKIKGVGTGTATITVTAEDGSGVTASVEVAVIIPVKKIILSETKQLPLAPMVSWRITTQAEPEEASIQSVHWATSNDEVAIVDENGNVTGVAPGTAKITAIAADGCGAKAAVTVKVEKYDLVFESMAPQSVHYSIIPGSHHIRGKVKNGCVSIPNLDYTLLLIGSDKSESLQVTPVKAGPDVVSILGTGRKAEFKVFVSPSVFPESGAAALPVENDEPKEVLILNIPWGTSYPDAKSILSGQGKKLKPPARKNDYIRAVLEGEVTFSNCTATNIALDFSYEEGSEDYKSRNELFKGAFYFDPEIPFEQIRLAVKSVFGLDNGEMKGNDCIWKYEDITLTLTRKERFIMLEICKQKTE